MILRFSWVVMPPISLLFLMILTSCSAMAKTPISLLIDVNLTKGQDIVFTGYYERISHENSLQRDQYIISGLHVSEDSCVHGECDRRVWQIDNPEAFGKQIKKQGAILPKEIVYGKQILTLKNVIKAETLKFDMPYFIFIGIMGINNDLKEKIYFSADAHFMLTKNKSGSTIIKQTGKDGVSLKWVIIE